MADANSGSRSRARRVGSDLRLSRWTGAVDQPIETVEFTVGHSVEFYAVARGFDVLGWVVSKLAARPDDVAGEQNFFSRSELDRDDDAPACFKRLPGTKIDTATR